MIRVLIIDDENPGFLDELEGDIKNIIKDPQVETHHVNPVMDLDAAERDAFLRKVEEIGRQFWDVAIIDLNLAYVRQVSEAERIQLPIQIAEAFRASNHSATVILYSGSLNKYISSLVSDRKGLPPEGALKRIFQAEISNFVARDLIVAEVLSALDNPSWLLRIDRLLMRHSTMRVSPQEAEFHGRGFIELAQSVRVQNRDGLKIAQLAAEYGISAFVDLNS